MNTIESNIVLGIGDLIYLRAMLYAEKHRFSQITLSFDNNILSLYRNNDYRRFLYEIGELFFSEPPFKLIAPGQMYKLRWPPDFQKDYGVRMIIPKLKHLLCKGTLLNLGREYMVFTTKIRYVPRHQYNRHFDQHFWHLIRQLSEKYKVVVMGERAIEMNREYSERGNGSDNIYSIYNDIMKNIPLDRVLDLTIPALGITTPNLSQIQQDCLIMSEAKFVVSIGIGGNVLLSVASEANVVNYREDTVADADLLFGITKVWDNSISTKELHHFMGRLRTYL